MVSELLNHPLDNPRDPNARFGLVIDCYKYDSFGKTGLRVLICCVNGEYHTGRVELEGRPRYLHRATVQFTPSETDEQAVYLRKSTGESVTAGVASNITEWQYPLPQGLAPTIKVRIETMDPLTNHGTYSTPGMNQPKKFIYNPAIMNDSASPQMGRIMWIATRTAFVGVEAYIEPYRFILDREEIERTRAFIAPQSLIDPLSHLFPGALLLRRLRSGYYSC